MKDEKGLHPVSVALGFHSPDLPIWGGAKMRPRVSLRDHMTQ